MKNKKVSKKVVNLIKKINKKVGKGTIEDNDVQEILNLLEQLENQI